MIKGILFDMDGVLIDSEPLILHAAISYFASLGVSVQKEDFTPFIGAGDRSFLCGVAEKYGLTLDFDEAKKHLFPSMRITLWKWAPLRASTAL